MYKSKLPGPLVFSRRRRKRTCLLHIGPPKTGSTALQNFCKKNAAPLAQAGIFYPTEFNDLYDFPVAQLVGTSNICAITHAQHFENSQFNIPDEFSPAKVISDLTGYLCGVDHHRVALLSLEDLAWAPIKFLEILVSELQSTGYDISVLMFIRRQPEWHASNYQQHVVQLGASFSYEEYLATRFIAADWYATAKKFLQLIDSKALMVRYVPIDRQHGFDLNEELVHILMSLTDNFDLHESVVYNTGTSSNKGISLVESVALAEAYKRGEPHRTIEEARSFAKSLSSAESSSKISTTLEKAQAKLIAQYLPSNLKLANLLPRLGATDYLAFKQECLS